MLVIKQARLYAPEPEGVQDILVEGGKIARIAPSIDEYDGIGEVEKLQLDGRRLAPGYIDCHEHITGGGGEQGPRTRVPEARLSTIFQCGVTTVLGLLGTDGITRSLENLQAKCQALNEEGLSCYMLTGSYANPGPTLTGDVERDIMLIHEVIGVKVAMSDHRSSNITGEELIRLGTLARRGGMLAGCAGLVTIHTGSGKAGLAPIFYALKNSDLPLSTFLPTLSLMPRWEAESTSLPVLQKKPMKRSQTKSASIWKRIPCCCSFPFPATPMGASPVSMKRWSVSVSLMLRLTPSMKSSGSW